MSSPTYFSSNCTPLRLVQLAQRVILYLALGETMSPRAELTSNSTPGDIVAAIGYLDQRFEYREKNDEERRKVDDARHQTLIQGQDRIVKGQEELVARVDNHGLRTTAIETKWEAFFGPQGAFGMVMRGIDEQKVQMKEQTKVSSRTNWILAVGVGIVLAAQFFAPYLHGLVK